jgi:hypothetical protein
LPDKSKYEKFKGVAEKTLSMLIAQDEAAQELRTVYESTYWTHVLSIGFDAGLFSRLEAHVWNCYNSGFRMIPEWNIFKNQIRAICLSLGSPHPHEEPLDNISELRLHLSHHNDLYTTIQKLNDKMEIQQRIITNLSFRHLLEHLTPKDSKNRGEAERWDNFWKKACSKAVADYENPPSEGETNAEHKAKRNAYRKVNPSGTDNATDKSVDGNQKSKSSEETSVSTEGLEPQNHQITPSNEIVAVVSMGHRRLLV